MIDKLYKARKGTEHIVRVIGKYREMLRGEILENTAHTYQVLAQRQEWVTLPKCGYDPKTSFWFRDKNFDPFTMEYELFMEEYEELQ